MSKKNYIIKIETDNNIKFIDFNDDFEDFEKNLPIIQEKYRINERHLYDKVDINYFVKVNDLYDFKETLKLKKKYRVDYRNQKNQAIKINYNQNKINEIYE
jgi:hypothetical protein